MLRIIFKKEDSIKYISHLDLMRTFQRLFMRAEIPVKYSEGFNPHMILNFALPLSVGATSERDFCEIQLGADMSTDEVKERLVKSAPDGITIVDVTNDITPAFKEVSKALFEVRVYSNKKSSDFIKFLSSEEILTEKKTKKGIKEVDIKPMIESYTVNDCEGYIGFEFLLAAGNTVNLNPSLIFKAAEKYIDGLETEYVSITRKNLYTEDNLMF